jgi:hypothetical protein
VTTRANNASPHGQCVVKAWAAAKIQAQPAGDSEALSNPDVLDQLVVWRMTDPRYTDRTNRVKGLTMQRQWTIEARADFADPEKNEAITTAIRQASVHVHAVMALLSDGQAPQVVCFSDDFFDGHQEIKLHEDKLGQAIEQHGGSMSEGKVSDELLQAARDMQHDKNNGEA